MKLTPENFFRELYFCPSKTDSYYTSLGLSVGLAVVSLGVVPAAVGICWAAKPTFFWIKDIIELTIKKTYDVAMGVLQTDEARHRREFSNTLKEWFKKAPECVFKKDMTAEDISEPVMRTMKDEKPLLVLKVIPANLNEFFRVHHRKSAKALGITDENYKKDLQKEQFIIGIQYLSEKENWILMDIRLMEETSKKGSFFNHTSYSYSLDKENLESNQKVADFFHSLLTKGSGKDVFGNEWKLVPKNHS